MLETPRLRSSGNIFFSAVTLGIMLAGTPDQAAGAAGDCGQPTSAGVAPVLRDPEGNERLMVPLHPDVGVAGGAVDVSITDGTEVCPIGPLQIRPLASALMDTSASVLAAFLALIDAIAADFGMTGAELATTPLDQLPSALIAPALTRIVLAGPDNANSFAAFLAGTAPVAEGDVDLDLLNRLLAKIGLFFDPDFICEPGTPIVVQKTFQLKGPTNPPEPDVIALVILVKALMISPFDPYTQTTGTVGSHALSGTIHSSVMIARTDPCALAQES